MICITLSVSSGKFFHPSVSKPQGYNFLNSKPLNLVPIAQSKSLKSRWYEPKQDLNDNVTSICIIQYLDQKMVIKEIKIKIPNKEN
jgi:hypothetical protein